MKIPWLCVWKKKIDFPLLKGHPQVDLAHPATGLLSTKCTYSVHWPSITTSVPIAVSYLDNHVPIGFFYNFVVLFLWWCPSTHIPIYIITLSMELGKVLENRYYYARCFSKTSIQSGPRPTQHSRYREWVELGVSRLYPAWNEEAWIVWCVLEGPVPSTTTTTTALNNNVLSKSIPCTSRWWWWSDMAKGPWG